ncbi:hypothetical protein RUND412_008416 [Rhizina undulata]
MANKIIKTYKSGNEVQGSQGPQDHPPSRTPSSENPEWRSRPAYGNPECSRGTGRALKGGRRAAKTKRRLAGKLEAEVPAAATGVQKEDKAGKRWAENLAGLVEKLRIEETTHEDEEIGDA